MKNVTPIAVLFSTLLAATPALANSDCPPAITVSGQAAVAAVPDLARVEAGVVSTATTANETAQANNAAMGKVVQALKKVGIDPKDVQTARLSLQPQYGPSSLSKANEAPAITGFRASNSVTVKIRDLARMSSVIDTLVSAGANDIGGISFEVTQASTLLDRAREQAIADARRKAEIYARATGVTLGSPISISESGAAFPIPLPRMGVAAMAAAAPPIATGESTLSVTVNVSWAITGNAR